MRFRVGFAIGVATGYVLGARAGRERYEQITATVQRFMGSEPGQRLAHTAGSAIERVEREAERVIEGVRGPSEATVVSRSEGGNGKI